MNAAFAIQNAVGEELQTLLLMKQLCKSCAGSASSKMLCDAREQTLKWRASSQGAEHLKQARAPPKT